MLGCSKSASGTGSNDAGDDAEDAAVVDSSLGDDAFFTDDLGLGDESTGGNCAVPDGTYLVTMTPSGDAGGSGCVPTTSTMTFPLPGNCMVNDQGMLPVCSIDFTCKQGGMGTTTTTDGYIQVYNGTFAGHESVQIVSTAVGMPVLSSCSYDTEYAKQ
jgi:hypothetical protein